MKKTLPEEAAEFQAKQDKRTLEALRQYKTMVKTAEKLGISRQALRMRLMRIKLNETKGNE